MKAIRLSFVLVLFLALAAPVLAADMPLLVTAEWLREQLGSPNLRVVDMQSGAVDYRQGHIPGAVYLDVDDARVKVPAGGYRLPNPDEMQRLLARLGFGRDTRVSETNSLVSLALARVFVDDLGDRGHVRISRGADERHASEACSRSGVDFLAFRDHSSIPLILSASDHGSLTAPQPL